MTVESFDVVFYTAIFVLPGFIMNGIISSLSPMLKPSEGILFLRSLLYSIVHCAIWSWMYKLIFRLERQNEYCYWLVLVIATLITSSVLALLLGIAKQKQIARKVLTFLGIYSIHSIPCSWDYAFDRRDPSWLIVTLVDGSIIYGWFSYTSFASSDPEERDLFIEKVYSVDESGVWCEEAGIEGVYISKEQIKTIEFLKGT